MYQSITGSFFPLTLTLQIFFSLSLFFKPFCLQRKISNYSHLLTTVRKSVIQKMILFFLISISPTISLFLFFCPSFPLSFSVFSNSFLLSSFAVTRSRITSCRHLDPWRWWPMGICTSTRHSVLLLCLLRHHGYWSSSPCLRLCWLPWCCN